LPPVVKRHRSVTPNGTRKSTRYMSYSRPLMRLIPSKRAGGLRRADQRRDCRKGSKRDTRDAWCPGADELDEVPLCRKAAERDALSRTERLEIDEQIKAFPHAEVDLRNVCGRSKQSAVIICACCRDTGATRTSRPVFGVQSNGLKSCALRRAGSFRMQAAGSPPQRHARRAPCSLRQVGAFAPAAR
jgi:hypothetical protein